MSSSDYSIDQVLVETHNIIEELKTRLVTESHRLAQLEATLPRASYNDANDYARPAWFGD